jgi:hypothetical protein
MQATDLRARRRLSTIVRPHMVLHNPLMEKTNVPGHAQHQDRWKVLLSHHNGDRALGVRTIANLFPQVVDLEGRRPEALIAAAG